MPNSSSVSAKSRSAGFPLPLDRAAIALMLAIAVLIGLLVSGGTHTAPRVRDFSWQDRQVGADDAAFIVNFSRPMDRASVEANLKIEPPLLGKTSWAGRRMAYTLEAPAPYGQTFRVNLQGATDRFETQNGQRSAMRPFTGEFKTRDRAFAYIGVTGEEVGRLVLYNLSTQQKQLLTPSNLVVMEFLPYPLGDRLLFAATERQGQGQSLIEQQLYQVSTGLRVQPPAQLDGDREALPPVEPAGTVKVVLDNKDYQNLKFDLSADGKIIVVQRVSRTNPADFGPWLLREGQPPEALKGNPGGDFLITPDSNSLAISQGQGLAILPLVPDAKPLDFLPKFGIVLDFAKDGTLAAMVKFNADRSRSLFLVSSQGIQKELFTTKGSIFSAQFDARKQMLYCLLSEIIAEGDLYREEPYLAAVDLKTGKQTPLLLLPGQFDAQLSLAPDGLGILLDQTTEAAKEDSQTTNQPRNSSGRVIANSRLWFLPIDAANPTAKVQPEALPLPGLRPRWLP